MSIHKSLRIKASLLRSRNVLSRHERILQLRKNGRWKEDETSPYGLPKVRVSKIKKRVKEKKAKEEAGATPAAAAAGAAPPAGAKAASEKAPAKGAAGAKK